MQITLTMKINPNYVNAKNNYGKNESNCIRMNARDKNNLAIKKAHKIST
jgi:hypothetical protein